MSSAKEDVKEEDTMSMADDMSRMSFEPARYSADQSMSLDRKVIGYKTRTISDANIWRWTIKKSNYGNMLWIYKH